MIFDCAQKCMAFLTYYEPKLKFLRKFKSVSINYPLLTFSGGGKMGYATHMLYSLIMDSRAAHRKELYEQPEFDIDDSDDDDELD